VFDYLFMYHCLLIIKLRSIDGWMLGVSVGEKIVYYLLMSVVSLCLSE
jgi:hypothetical protein